MINCSNYEFAYTKTTIRNTDIFSGYYQAQDESEQFDKLLCEENVFGGNYIPFIPRKRKKFSCPMECGNTYVWLDDVYESIDKQRLVYIAVCARCGEQFLMCYKRKNSIIF